MIRIIIFFAIIWGGSVWADENNTNAPLPDKTQPMTDIHDIQPPEPAGFDPSVIYYGIAAILLIGFLAGVFYWWKNRKQPLKSKITPSLPPEILALNALDELMDMEDGKAFYFRLSAIVRRYMEGQFGISAPDMTTEELLPQLDQLGLDKELIKPLKELFYSGDFIKFAGVHAIAVKMETDLAFVKKFVEQTTPKQETLPQVT